MDAPALCTAGAHESRAPAVIDYSWRTEYHERRRYVWGQPRTPTRAYPRRTARMRAGANLVSAGASLVQCADSKLYPGTQLTAGA